MSDETKTDAASGDPVIDSPELGKLEQAVEAVSEDTPDTSNEEPAKEDAPEMGQAFQDLAEKKGFKSVDDLVQAYQNAEGQNTKLAQEMKGLAKEVKQINAPQADDPYKDLPEDQKQALDLLRGVVGEVVDTKLQPLRTDLDNRSAQSEIDAVKGEYSNASESQIDQAITVVENHPSLTLDDAMKIVTYGEARIASTAQQSKAAKDKQKTRAFVESNKTAKTGGDIDYSKLSLEELEKILPKSGQFIDHKGVLRR